MARPRISDTPSAVKRRERYRNNPGPYRERTKAWQAKTRIEVQQLFAEFRSKGCINCGEMHPAVLEAHHRDPAQKEYRIWEWRHNNLASAKVAAELAKCDCICSNCHRKLHFNVSGEDRAPQRNYKRRWALNKQARERLLNSNGGAAATSGDGG